MFLDRGHENRHIIGTYIGRCEPLGSPTKRVKKPLQGWFVKEVVDGVNGDDKQNQ
jgi:hypothetical protein